MAASLVQEIVPLPRLARVPHAPAALLGVAQIRGVIVPVLSVASLLGRAQSPVQRVIVAEMDGLVGLAVTRVSQIVNDDEAICALQVDFASLIGAAVPERRERRSAGAIVAATGRTEEAPAEAVVLVAFAVAGQDFALPLSSTEEVLRLPAGIARLPHADAAALGSVASRGAVLPLLSLAALLALPIAPMTGRSRVVVVRIGAHRVGLVVDAMRSIERVAEREIDAVPQVLNRGGSEARIQAICRLDGGTRLVSVLAPDQLVDKDITARLLQGETRGKGEMTGGTDVQDERFLLFRIGEESFGLPIDAVQEVALLPPRLTPLPKAPAFVQGVMNVRGQVIPVIDQARRFNGVPVVGSKARVIVVRIGELTAGFTVDAVSQVVQPSADALRPAPDLGSEGARVFDRVAALDGEDTLVLIVSPQELLDRAERDLLLALGKTKAAQRKP
ncbi:chemotaxis signal transduction protein [Novosphingobium sp. AP12]|nr:chemotaxis signal transduction protein [Novosphingobium sp. AP12]